MQHENRTLEPHGVDGSIRAPIPILDNLQHAGGTEATERLSLLVLPAILRKVKRESEKVHYWRGQGEQIPLRAPHPLQRFQGRTLVHLRSLYPHWYNDVADCPSGRATQKWTSTRFISKRACICA